MYNHRAIHADVVLPSLPLLYIYDGIYRVYLIGGLDFNMHYMYDMISTTINIEKTSTNISLDIYVRANLQVLNVSYYYNIETTKLWYERFATMHMMYRFVYARTFVEYTEVCG